MRANESLHNLFNNKSKQHHFICKHNALNEGVYSQSLCIAHS